MKNKVIAIILITFCMLFTSCSFMEKENQSTSIEYSIDTKYVSRLDITYGELKKTLSRCQPEFEYNSRYYVGDSNVFYNFIAKDWKEDDDDLCFYISAQLGVLVPNIKESISLNTFINSFQSVGFASYEVKDGQPTHYYIAEKYALINFDMQRDNGSSYGCTLEIELLDGNIITPKSLTWLKHVAG